MNNQNVHPPLPNQLLIIMIAKPLWRLARTESMMRYHKKSRSRASAKLALRQPETTVSHTLQTPDFSSFSINTETLNTQQRMIAFNSSIAVHYANRWSSIELIYICRCDWGLWLLHHIFIEDCFAKHLGYKFTCFLSTTKRQFIYILLGP